MGFFKDFKADLSQAVNELSDDASKLADVSAEKVEEPVPDDDVMVDTLANDMQSDAGDSDIEESLTRALADIKADDKKPESAARKTTAKAVKEDEKSVQAKETAEETLVTAGADEISDETAIITPGLSISGDVTSAGSIELFGTVEGNVTCKGKLVVSGTIKGNSVSSDFFADKANITGDVTCEGPAKIGNGSVIIGNLVATSAVIAGAIKGDIDVQGPVIIDTTAIVMGDIKSKLVQINNGAVIEGHCSQCYSDNSPKEFFGEN